MEEGNNTYDAIILGTGLKEGIISALLSVHGKKVLHIDRNDYYGAECASLNLTQLYQKFGEDPSTIPADYGNVNDWCIDMVPKFIMSGGDMMKMLRHADCLMYLDFGRVAGSFVLKDERIHRVPCTTKEALASKLMGLFEKKRMANLLSSISGYFERNEPMKQDPKVATVRSFFKEYKLDDQTRDFMIHAMGLYTNDDCLDQPAHDCFHRFYLYMYSVNLYGASPFIYPMYGLGDLPQAFSRLSAVWGGTYMLNKPIDEILYDESTGKVTGIRSGSEKAYAPLVIGDPSYFPDLVRKVGRVGRGICLMRGPIRECADASETEKDGKGGILKATSSQVIITGIGAGTGRKEDIYVTTQGYNHRTTPRHMCVGFVSGVVESEDPAELQTGWKILERDGNVVKKFYRVYDLYEPDGDKAEQRNVFITKSYDASSHFESTIAETVQLYERITGEKLDLNSKIQRPPIPGMEVEEMGAQ